MNLFRTTRRVLVAGALAVMFGGAVFTGTASASTVLAQGCTGSVVGNIGDEIAVQGKDVADLVRAGAKEQEIFLHLNGVNPDGLADTITKAGALPVGSVPNAANGSITGDNVATAVADALKNADGLGFSADQRQKTLNSISTKVAGNCGMTVYAGNYSSPTTLPSSGAVPPPATTLPTSSPSTAIAPPRDYGNIPAAVPGVAVSPGARYPTSAPIAGLPTPEVLPGSPTGQTDVRNAGEADAIAAPPSSGTVQLPMLLAVVALAGVSAALVRTWVLRKLS
ncbi:hypothetical protein [Amycolatopsis alkalitolerans]|uniref:Uncharacterized protein n=1 Tax=Amycolatopsis alkalitolerans TaxID=2547244 RepID=A0A5C4M5S4_9PSEU|nr:hypothetical protein [Amycolatopsis alkalitolerans]TNC27233.1 hypothetical protein FG385_09065 [Amycolatopsis alkalitolerans]